MMRAHAPFTATTWPWAALIASAAMLAAAHGFERFALLAPCQLCLRQREVYWAAGAIALAGLVLARVRPGLAGLACFALAAAFLTGAGIAGYHAGVEQGVFPAPDGCAGGGPMPSGADLMAQLGKPMATASCGEIPWSLLGLSMAAWNALVSLGLAGASVFAALGPGRPVKETRHA